MDNLDTDVINLVPSVARSESRPESCPVIDLTDAKSGDLFFGARPSPLQFLCVLSGERWRHVGLIHSIDGTLYVIEGGRGGLQRRPLTTAAARYSRVGIARLAPEFVPGAVEAVEWAADEKQGSYAFPMMVAVYAGWCSFARNRLTVSPKLMVRSPFAAYASKLDGQSDVATCSHLVLLALARSGIDVSLGSGRAVGDLPATMDCLVTPGDVWRLPILARRYAVVPPTDQVAKPPANGVGKAMKFLKSAAVAITQRVGGAVSTLPPSSR